ncbi:MAG: hypothetical protein OXG44_15135 [Gammaproteobacteria bacterium]|nr:hypothetical protein [Gammaproteobacteria bacterium]
MRSRVYDRIEEAEAANRGDWRLVDADGNEKRGDFSVERFASEEAAQARIDMLERYQFVEAGIWKPALKASLYAR